MSCVRDQNGNHVIQKAIEMIKNHDHIAFIMDAFAGEIGKLATHSYGCRVIQRMLEHCEPGRKRAILQELHAEGETLITDPYGNYVTQHIVEHGGPEDRDKVIALVTANTYKHSKHKFASNVVEKCLKYGTDAQRRDIMLELVKQNSMNDPNNNLLTLVKDGFGNYVIRKPIVLIGIECS